MGTWFDCGFGCFMFEFDLIVVGLIALLVAGCLALVVGWWYIVR